MRITLLMVLGLAVGWAQSDPGDALQQLLAEGNAAVQAGQFDAAIARFQKVIESLDPDSPAAGDLYLRLGETQRRKGDLDGAIQSLARANDLLPSSSENIGCMSGSGACTRNALEFKNYRKFTTESNITFGK